MNEQEKDAKLYELICKSVLSERDLNKIIEKCRYDEDRDEWIIPFTKKKSLESFEMSPSVGPSNNRHGGGSLLLPDINQSSNNNGTSNAMVGAMSSVVNLKDRINSADPNLRLVASSPPGNAQSRPTSNTVAKVVIRKDGTKNVVPLLTLPGSLISAAEAMAAQDSTRADNGFSRFPNPYVNPTYTNEGSSGSNINGGIGYDNYRDEKKAKKAGKKASKPPTAPMPSITASNTTATTIPPVASGGGNKPSVDKMPPIIASNKNAANGNRLGQKEGDENENINQDMGGASAGPIESWDWNNEGDKKMPPIINHKNGKAFSGPQDSNHPEAEYSDDEDFATNGNASNVLSNDPQGHIKKKKKKKRSSKESESSGGGEGSNGSGLPPIDSKYQTPRGLSLPPI